MLASIENKKNNKKYKIEKNINNNLLLLSIILHHPFFFSLFLLLPCSLPPRPSFWSGKRSISIKRTSDTLNFTRRLLDSCQTRHYCIDMMIVYKTPMVLKPAPLVVILVLSLCVTQVAMSRFYRERVDGLEHSREFQRRIPPVEARSRA